MVSVSVFHICFCLLNWNLPYRIFVRLSAKFRFIGVNITNLQQIVSVFELYRKLLGDNAPVRDRHRPFSFLSVIRFYFECFPDCDIHIPNHQYGLIEIKLGGDSLIKKGAETLNALAEKLIQHEWKAQRSRWSWQLPESMHTEDLRMESTLFLLDAWSHKCI